MKESGASIDRRSFVGVLAATAVAGRGATAWAPQAVDRVGVQVYTVRSLMTEAPDATLAALAEIGYRDLELAGLYGMTPVEMRLKVNAAGLRVVSSHPSLADVRRRWHRTLEGAVELGQGQLVVPSIGGSERSLDGLARVADDFNRAGEAAREAGLRFGYHNHDWEFAPLPDGTPAIEVLLARCDPELVEWQMDIFWVVSGGGDPLELLQAHAGRVTSVHVKDRSADGEMVDVGMGVIDFRTILARASGLGLRHAFVEHDHPADPMESVRASYGYLRTLGY